MTAWSRSLPFWRIMYALALAEAMERAPFVFNPHRLPYTGYTCVWCGRPPGTHMPRCERCR